jgi:hypothetical protein
LHFKREFKYLAVIKNSIGSKLFRNFYAKVNGKKEDIMRNGDLSCAFYASSILALFKLIKEVHGTVDSTVKDLKKAGWEETNKPLIGSVLVWEKIDFKNSGPHKHIGFFIGNNKAISNSFKLGYPIEHHWTFKDQRKVEMILRNKKLK